MTSKSIEEQIAVLRKVGEEVCASKESAIEFLIQAGIIKNEAIPEQHQGRNLRTVNYKNSNKEEK